MGRRECVCVCVCVGVGVGVGVEWSARNERVEVVYKLCTDDMS